MFRQSAIECKIPLPENLPDMNDPPHQYSLDKLLDAYTRVSYVQPISHITDDLEATFTQDWAKEWERLIETTPSARDGNSGGSEKYMQITSLLN